MGGELESLDADDEPNSSMIHENIASNANGDSVSPRWNRKSQRRN